MAHEITGEKNLRPRVNLSLGLNVPRRMTATKYALAGVHACTQHLKWGEKYFVLGTVSVV
jgi:hypothetical protein